jgi:IS5 family transposase
MTPKQMSLSMQHGAGFERRRKATRRDMFLVEMDQVVP